MFFDELSNDEWAHVSALVSDEPAVRLNRRGRPRAEPRIVTNAVLWILTTGEPWSKLPGRYPSGPTCRRRFEEWQANGTLSEIVRLLTQGGRTFAYIPEPVQPAAPKPAPVIEAPKPRDDLARGVFWKSPETWQSSSQEQGATNGAPSGWCALAPMADITRQLAGSAAVETGFVDARVNVENAASVSAPDSAAAFGAAQRVDERVDGHGDGLSVGFADEFAQVQAGIRTPMADASSIQHEPHHDSTPEDEQAANSQHTPLWMSLTAPRGLQVADRHGYVIYVSAEPVQNGEFRAWAEIMNDGKRVERSGLIGPRFADADAAHRFALDWARQWIDRECATQDAAGLQVQPLSTHATAPGLSAPKVAVRPLTRPMPELTPTPARAANIGTAVAGNPHLPQHLNPRLMPLRRYPSDAVKDTAGERYPSLSTLISYVG